MLGLAAAAVAALVLAATPYVDPRGRFRLELAEGFELEPRFGDIDGVRFVLPENPRRGGGPVEFEVHVLGPQACGRGERVEIEGRTWRQIERRGGVEFTRVELDRCLRVRIGGSRRARGRVRGRTRPMLASVARLPARAPPPSAPEKAPVAPTAASRARDPRLVGIWTTDHGGARLRLGPNGRFELGSVSGRWRSSPGRLELFAKGGVVLELAFELGGDVLALSGGGLPAGTRYVRASAPTPGPATSTGPEPADREEEDPERAASSKLVGVWRASGVELTLEAEGRFRLGPWTGAWRLDGGRLRLDKGPVDQLSYRVGFEGDRLVLAGADLDAPVRFTRVGAPASSR